MIDLDLLARTLTSRITAVEGVQRLYPSRIHVLGLPVLGGAQIIGRTRGTVTAVLDGQTLHIETTIGVTSTDAAIATTGAVAAVINDELDRLGHTSRHVTVRVASID